MKDKIVLVTGATSGFGLAAAGQLSRMGATVIVHARNRARCERALALLRGQGGGKFIPSLIAELSAQGNVRELARELLEKHRRLDVLINDAGAVYLFRRRSVDGIEMTFATNHLAPFLLTDLLLPLLQASPAARIVNVASDAHYGNPVDFDDLELERGYTPLKAYSRSKFANILFTYALARRLEGTNVTANVLHPGFVATGLGSNNGVVVRLIARLVMSAGITPEEGARTVVYLAASPDVEDVKGRYFYRQELMRSDKRTYEIELQERLWKVSEKMTGLSV